MKTVWIPAVSFKKRKGFTITEMLVVIGIVGILMGVVMVGLKSSRNRARVATAKNEMQFYGLTIKQYRSSRLFLGSDWPTTSVGLNQSTTYVDKGGTTQPINCRGTNLFPVAPELVKEGLWKEATCSKYFYYNDSGTSGEVGIQWPGISGSLKSRDYLKTGTGPSWIEGSDNLLLIIQDPNDATRKADLNSANLKPNVIYLGK